MSEPAAATHPFRVYTLNDDNTKKTYVGGSYDNISAVTIACAMYGAMQNFNVVTWRQIAVFDSTDTPIAVIGGEQDPPIQTAPADPVPTLSTLVPDSSGNWNAEITLTGTNFLATSQVLANGNPVTPVTYDSPTQLRAIAPATAAGAYAIKVRNGSADSNALTFTAL